MEFWTILQRVATFILVVLVIALLFVPLSRQVADYRRLQLERARLQEDLQIEQRFHQELLEDIGHLRSSTQHMERVARERLQMSRPDEMVFHFDPIPDEVSPTNTPRTRGSP